MQIGGKPVSKGHGLKIIGQAGYDLRERLVTFSLSKQQGFDSPPVHYKSIADGL